MAKKWKIIGLVVAILAIAIGGCYYYLTWEGDTTELRSVADKFKPDPAWITVSKNIRPDKNIYIDGPENDSASYAWKSKNLVTKKEFIALLDISHLNYSFEGECDPAKSPRDGVCSATSHEGRYTIRISITHPSDNNPTQINLYVNKT